MMMTIIIWIFSLEINPSVVKKYLLFFVSKHSQIVLINEQFFFIKSEKIIIVNQLLSLL